MKIWFQAFAFKCSSYRYTMELEMKKNVVLYQTAVKKDMGLLEVGAVPAVECNSPQLESVRVFKPRS